MHDRAVATVSILTPDQHRFLEAARSATLATTGPGLRARLVPICFVVEPESAGGLTRIHSPLDEKPKTASDPRALGRVIDLRDRPAATILVDRWSEDWSRLGWLRLDVRGTVLDPGGDGDEHAAAIAALRAKYDQYATHRLEARPILRFEVDRVVGWGDLRVD